MVFWKRSVSLDMMVLAERTWRWILLRLLKNQSPTVLFTLTQMITQDDLYWLSWIQTIYYWKVTFLALFKICKNYVFLQFCLDTSITILLNYTWKINFSFILWETWPHWYLLWQNVAWITMALNHHKWLSLSQVFASWK